MEQKVVKCSGCDLYFMHTEKVTKCPFPFCKTEYVEVGPVRGRESSQYASASSGVEEKDTNKKWTTKTRKESFKIWKK